MARGEGEYALRGGVTSGRASGVTSAVEEAKSEAEGNVRRPTEATPAGSVSNQWRTLHIRSGKVRSRCSFRTWYLRVDRRR